MDTTDLNQGVNSRTGLPKHEQYKWIMTGEPGTLMYVSKFDLQIDHAYQRQAKNVRVLKLAKRWNWLACGVLIVAQRGGFLYVVDGQHRLLAALKRSDVLSLPCVIFQSSELREEAIAFRDANKERRPMTTLEQWNADIVAEDEATLFAHDLITKADRVPANIAGANSVRCLSAVVGAVRNCRDEFVRVWPLVVQICKGSALHERVLGSLLYLECNLADGVSVTNQPWRGKVVKLGYKGILDASQRAAAFYAKGGAKVWAVGVMQELNKGNRVNTLSLKSDAGSI